MLSSYSPHTHLWAPRMCTTSPMFILTLILNLTNISLFAPLLWSSYLTHTHSWALHIDKTSTSNLSGEGPLILQLVLLRTLTPMLLLMLILTIVLLYYWAPQPGAHTTLLQCPDLLHFTFADRLPEEHSYHVPQQVPSITKCSSAKYHTFAASCETDWNAAHNTRNQHLRDTWHPALRGYRDTLGQLYTNKHMNKGQTLSSMSHLNSQML